MARRIDSYAPKMPPEYWAHIEPFVRESIHDAKPDRWLTAQPWMSMVAGLTLWCWQSAGLELVREVVFDPNTISRYVNEHDAMKASSRGTTRSVLLRISKRLLGENGKAWEHERYANSKGSNPYARAEITELRSYMQGQATDYRLHNVRAILALGGGAGLHPHEMLAARAEHVSVTGSGIVIAVQGERARTVPLIAEWDDLMLATLDSALPDQKLVLGSRIHRSKAAVTDFLYTCNGLGLRPHTQRLRSTWLVAHLNAATPVPLLLRAAGLEQMSSLTRYLEYLNPVPDDENTLLRLVGKS